MNEIILTRDARSWCATFAGPHGDEIERLFGTRTLPTGFTTRAHADQVQAAIAANNPGVTVRIGEPQ